MTCGLKVQRTLGTEGYLKLPWTKYEFVFSFRMIGGVAGRHMSTRRRGSSPMVRLGVPGEQLEPWSGLPTLQPPVSPRYRRRRAVTTSDFKSCALVQTRVKLGDIM